MKSTALAACTAVVSLASLACAADHPIETGSVEWGRQLDPALEAARESEKPIFLLFQEIPGCAGCKQFGREVMSDPRIVDAVESAFVPLLIANNQPGSDDAVRRRFKEPAWNYQVVRFLDDEARDLIPRRDKIWTTGPLAARMIRALEAAERPVPRQLALLAAEHSEPLAETAFAMHCFWVGEARLGRLDGVVTTEAGFLDGKEVTRVRYDPATLPLARLIREAERLDCAHALFLPADELATAPAARFKPRPLEGYRRAPESDQKRQLRGTPAAALELSPAQATKLNAWWRADRERALEFLTGEQRADLE